VRRIRFDLFAADVFAPRGAWSATRFIGSSDGASHVSEAGF